MKPTDQPVLEFTNEHCRNNNHQECKRRWNGFGFEVKCSCDCHLDKKEEALVSVGEPLAIASSALQSPSLEEIQRG